MGIAFASIVFLHEKYDGRTSHSRIQIGWQMPVHVGSLEMTVLALRSCFGIMRDVADQGNGTIMIEEAVAAISADESWDIFDTQTRKILGCSGEEFARRWDNGEFADSEDNRLMKLVMLRPSNARK